MEHYESMVLENGLQVFLHEDPLTPLIAVNLMYKVGSADEDTELTGLAHFLEHMMFTGTEKFPNYDDPLQYAGGDCNAYTSSDVTSYHAQLPAQNLPILLALEADRMQHLSLNKEAFLTQKSVILEEFKEQYLMKPYGDLWPTIKQTIYHENHPYSWMPIGKDLEAIKKISLKDLEAFYKKYYEPSNACLAIAGNLPLDEMRNLVKQYFNDIPSPSLIDRQKPDFNNPEVSSQEIVTLTGKVAEPIMLWTTKMPPLFSNEYYIAEFWLHYLDSQDSSPLYDYLVIEEELATDVNAYHSESIEEGIFAIEFRGMEEDNIEAFGEKVVTKLQAIFKNGMTQDDQKSILNKIKTALLFEELSIEYKAHNMAYYGLLKQSNYLKDELKKYAAVTWEDINDWSQNVIEKSFQKIFYYLPEHEN